MSRNDSDAIELDHFSASNWEEETANEGPNFSLPPADGGYQAWLFLVACFTIEALVWGFPFSFGVFETYYSTHEPFSHNGKGIAAIGTSATGIMYFSAPIVFFFNQRYPRIRRSSSVLGLVILLAGIVTASFANTVWQLILYQGVLYAVGGGLYYFPAIMYLDEWFIRRKGLAYGIMWAGTGAAGIVIPIVMDWILQRWGFRTALRAWAVIMAILSTPCLFFLKGRLPTQHSAQGPRKIDLSFLKTSTFWILQIGNTMQGLGYFMPSIYMPSYARTIGLSNLKGTLSVSLFNAASVVGCLFIGSLVDRFHVTTAIAICISGSALSIFVFWGLATNTVLLYIFAILYGIFGGGYSASWSGCAGAIRREAAGAEMGIIIALLAAGKGVGAVVSGPLSEKLLAADDWKGNVGGAYGTGYGGLVVFSGATAACGGVSWVARRFGWV